jgi:hypothetical protein
MAPLHGSDNNSIKYLIYNTKYFRLKTFVYQKSSLRYTKFAEQSCGCKFPKRKIHDSLDSVNSSEHSSLGKNSIAFLHEASRYRGKANLRFSRLNRSREMVFLLSDFALSLRYPGHQYQNDGKDHQSFPSDRNVRPQAV